MNKPWHTIFFRKPSLLLVKSIQIPVVVGQSQFFCRLNPIKSPCVHLFPFLRWPMTAMPGHAAELEAKVAAQKAETVLAAVLPPWKRTETWERTGEMLGDLGQSNWIWGFSNGIVFNIVSPSVSWGFENGIAFLSIHQTWDFMGFDQPNWWIYIFWAFHEEHMMWEEINWFIRWWHQTWLGGKSPNEMEGLMGKHGKTTYLKLKRILHSNVWLPKGKQAQMRFNGKC